MPVEFSLLLQAARKQASLSQVELAAKTGISRPFIGLLEQGRRTVPAGDLEKLAKALGLDGAEKSAFLDAGHNTHATDPIRLGTTYM